METSNLKTNKLSAMLVSELIGKKVVDESAQTLLEIASATVPPVCPATAERMVKKLLAAGKIEAVWKRGSQRLVPAYRVKL
jgi:hypothetical protein